MFKVSLVYIGNSNTARDGYTVRQCQINEKRKEKGNYCELNYYKSMSICTIVIIPNTLKLEIITGLCIIRMWYIK